MISIDPEILWRQFGAAIDMLGDTLRECPDELWGENLWGHLPAHSKPEGFSAFWHLGYHTLFWLDLYLTGAEEGFAPPAPFDLPEIDEEGALTRTLTRNELLAYLDFCRRKCRDTIAALDDEQARRLCRFPWGELPFAELLLYNLRHVVEHGAQLRMALGQRANRPARWEARAR